MKIRKIPDQLPEEQIYGFQLLLGNNKNNYFFANSEYSKAFDIYICLDWASFNFYCNYEKGEYLAFKLGIFNFGYTNLNSLFDDAYYESNDA